MFGEYGVYVIPCFAVTVVLMAGIGFFSWREKKNLEKQLGGFEKPEDSHDG